MIFGILDCLPISSKNWAQIRRASRNWPDPTIVEIGIDGELGGANERGRGTNWTVH